MFKKSNAYLYHYTTFENFLQIWKDGTLKPTPQSQGPAGVCLTRNPNMHLRWPHKGVKITLDVSKLNAPLTPYLHPGENREGLDYRYEAEERCYREIKKVIRAIVRVDINLNFMTMAPDRLSLINKIENHLEASNIPYEITDLSNKTPHLPEEKRGRDKPNTEFLDSALLRLDRLVQSEDMLSANSFANNIRVFNDLIDDIKNYTPDPYESTPFAFDMEDLEYLKKGLNEAIDILLDYSFAQDNVAFELSNILSELKALQEKTNKSIDLSKDETDLVFLKSLKPGKTSEIIEGALAKIQQYLRTKGYREDAVYDYEEFIGYMDKIKFTLEVARDHLKYTNNIVRNRNKYLTLKTKLVNYYQMRNKGDY